MQSFFENSDDVVFQTFVFGPDRRAKAIAVLCESLVSDDKLNMLYSALESLIHRCEEGLDTITADTFASHFDAGGLSKRSATVVTDISAAAALVLKGYSLVFIDGWDKAVGFKMARMEGRAISEPMNEPVVTGPHESTVENLNTNLGLLRIKLATTDLKIEKVQTGGEANATVALCYLQERVDREALDELKRRLQSLQDKTVLETTYVEEWMEDRTWSPFPQFRLTERPDVAAAAMLEGKIAVLLSGSPTIVIAPSFFVEFLTSSEDYYNRFIYASLIRILRITAFFMALLLPSFYIALTEFHSELIPNVLLLSILDSREGIPFPSIIEALLMEFFFELLREAGIRLPRPVGSAVSIVGALVIGQAAIQAKIASPIMVIVVALTGIASFSIPQYNIAVAVRVLRFPLMLCAASFGGFGLMIGTTIVLIHLMTLTSLGIPYLTVVSPLRPAQLRDVLIRAPMEWLIRAPRIRRSIRYKR